MATIIYRSDDPGAESMQNDGYSIREVIGTVFLSGYSGKPSINSISSKSFWDLFNDADDTFYFGSPNNGKGGMIIDAGNNDINMNAPYFPMRLFNSNGSSSFDQYSISPNKFTSIFDSHSVSNDEYVMIGSNSKDRVARPWIIIADEFGAYVITFPNSNGSSIPKNDPGIIHYIGFAKNMIGDSSYDATPIICIGVNAPGNTSLGYGEYLTSHPLSPFNNIKCLVLSENGESNGYYADLSLNPLGSGCVSNGPQGAFLEYSKVCGIARSQCFGIDLAIDGGHGEIFEVRGLRQISKASNLQNLDEVDGAGEDAGKTFYAIRFKARNSETMQIFLIQKSLDKISNDVDGVDFTSYSPSTMPKGYKSLTGECNVKSSHVFKKKLFQALSVMDSIASDYDVLADYPYSSPLKNSLVHAICPSFDFGIVHPNNKTVYSNDYQNVFWNDKSFNNAFVNPIGFDLSKAKPFNIDSSSGFTYVGIVRNRSKTNGSFRFASIGKVSVGGYISNNRLDIMFESGVSDTGAYSFKSVSAEVYDMMNVKIYESQNISGDTSSLSDQISTRFMSNNDFKLIVIRYSKSPSVKSEIYVDGNLIGFLDGNDSMDMFQDQKISYDANSSIDIAFSGIFDGMFSKTRLYELFDAWVSGSGNMLFMHSGACFEDYVHGNPNDLTFGYSNVMNPETYTYSNKRIGNCFEGYNAYQTTIDGGDCSEYTVSFDVATHTDFNSDTSFGVLFDIFTSEKRIISMQYNAGNFDITYGVSDGMGGWMTGLLTTVPNNFNTVSTYGDLYNPDFNNTGGRVELYVSGGMLKRIRIFDRDSMDHPNAQLLDYPFEHTIPDGCKITFGRSGFVYPDEVADYPTEFDHWKKNKMALTNFRIRRGK